MQVNHRLASQSRSYSKYKSLAQNSFLCIEGEKTRGKMAWNLRMSEDTHGWEKQVGQGILLRDGLGNSMVLTRYEPTAFG
jgi:hypothetical protein